MASFWLEYEQNGALQKFPFDAQTISIGRDKSSDFVLDHPTVSRQHALIMNQGGGVFRLVVMSRGGLTAIDGQPVETEVALYDDAVLHIGRLSFRFRSDYAPRRPAGMPMGGAPMGGAPMGGAAMGGAPMGGMPQAGFGGAGGFQAPGQAMGQGFGAGQPVGGMPAGGAGFGMPPGQQGGFGVPVPGGAAPAASTPAAEGAGGIVSWDDIAQSDAARDDEGIVQVSDYQKIRNAAAKGAKKEEGNPLIMIVGVVGIIAMLVFIFMPQDDGMGGQGEGGRSFDELPPLELSVDCLGEADCLRKAQAAYRLGVELIERRDVENRNLFEGYKKLAEAKELLAVGGIAQIPADMNRLTTLHDQARADLDQLFRGLRMRYKQLETNRMYKEMVDILNSIQVFFPDRTARENRWAVAHERQMRLQGVYPRSDF
jgi:hypothetical protein